MAARQRVHRGRRTAASATYDSRACVGIAPARGYPATSVVQAGMPIDVAGADGDRLELEPRRRRHREADRRVPAATTDDDAPSWRERITELRPAPGRSVRVLRIVVAARDDRYDPGESTLEARIRRVDPPQAIPGAGRPAQRARRRVLRATRLRLPRREGVPRGRRVRLPPARVRPRPRRPATQRLHRARVDRAALHMADVRRRDRALAGRRSTTARSRTWSLPR